MVIKSIAAIPPVPLDNVKTQNNEGAITDIPRHLSAGAAWAIGFIDGGDELDTDTPNTAPRSPMHGLRGHTHSGGMDGRALLRSIASASLDDFSVRSSNLTTADDVGEEVLLAPRPEGSPPSAPLADPGDDITKSIGPPIVISVPGCDQAIGAYQDLGVRITYYVANATNVAAGDTLYFTVRNTVTSAAVELSTASVSTGFAYLSSSQKGGTPRETLATLVGKPNHLQIEVRLAADGTAGTRLCRIKLVEIELGVYET